MNINFDSTMERSNNFTDSAISVVHLKKSLKNK